MEKNTPDEIERRAQNDRKKNQLYTLYAYSELEMFAGKKSYFENAPRWSWLKYTNADWVCPFCVCTFIQFAFAREQIHSTNLSCLSRFRNSRSASFGDHTYEINIHSATHTYSMIVDILPEPGRLVRT